MPRTSIDKESEQRDLAELKSNVSKERELAFAMMLEIDRATTETLRHMGYSRMTKDEAIAHVYRSVQRKINNLTRGFLNKYPDER